MTTGFSSEGIAVSIALCDISSVEAVVVVVVVAVVVFLLSEHVPLGVPGSVRGVVRE